MSNNEALKFYANLTLANDPQSVKLANNTDFYRY